MIKFVIELKEGMVIHCPQKESSKRLLIFLKNHDYTWMDGQEIEAVEEDVHEYYMIASDKRIAWCDNTSSPIVIEYSEFVRAYSSPIYVVMVFESLDYSKGSSWGPEFGNQRIVGYYYDKEMAFDAVKLNSCGICEACYGYALIEEIEPGFYRPASKDGRWFFKYNREKDEYEPIDEPNGLEHLCGFTIG